MTDFMYQVGGSLNTNAPTYAKRKADDFWLRLGPRLFANKCPRQGRGQTFVRSDQ